MDPREYALIDRRRRRNCEDERIDMPRMQQATWPPRELIDCRDRLKVVLTVPVTLRTSMRGVPHLVIGDDRGRVSVCWFASTQTFAMFYPYAPGHAVKQRRKDYHGIKGVVRRLRKWRGKP